MQFQLYNYEVAEAFFLCKKSEQYVELEFGPHGEHLVLFLDGRRNDIMKMLPLNYTVSIGKHLKMLFRITHLHFLEKYSFNI